MIESIFENSMICKVTKKILSFLMNLTTASRNRVAKYFSAFNMQAIGIVVISAMLVNLIIAYIMRMDTKLEWIFFRCLIVISFLPWLFCGKKSKEIIDGSVFLKLFRGRK